MAEQKNFDFSLTPDMVKDGKVQITILEGSPEPHNIPVALNVNCTLDSINDWIVNEAQKSQIDVKKAVLLLDYENLTATLLLDPTNSRVGKIQGAAVLSEDYKALKLNMGPSNGSFTRVQFESILKLKRVLFPDRTEHGILLSAVKNFQATFNGNVQQANNSRGSKAINFNKDYNVSELPERIKISVPIFKGTTTQDFYVDICLDTPSENSVIFWLESMEVEEAKRKASYEMMDTIKKNYTDFGIVVLKQ